MKVRRKMSDIYTKQVRVHVEGNIASGKSSLLEFLKTKEQVTVLPEPLEKWQNVDGVNVFERYYSNTKKYAYAFQTYAMLSLLERNAKTSLKPIQVFERSLDSIQNVFIKLLKKTENIDSTECAVLKKHLKFMEKYFDNEKPDLIIYVRTSPDVVYNRIKSRGRSEERAIDRDTVKILHSLHEAWYEKLAPGDVFVIDGDCTFEQLEDEYRNCFHAIKTTLYNKEFEHLRETLDNFGFTSD